jgi:sialate O-acetylesterase
VAKEYRPNLRKPELPPKPLELPSPESVLQGFDLCEMRAQADGSHAPHWEHARARIEGDTVVVWSPQITRPEAVRYAWADHPVCNLENGAGLPAFAFRTDAFPLPQTQKP